MWQCKTCSEQMEDSFEVCWNCGTSQDGVEDAAFQAEVDAAETATSVEMNSRCRGLMAGAVVAGAIGYFDFVVPCMVALRGAPWGQRIMMAGAIWALWAAAGGGVAGWDAPSISLARLAREP